MIDLHNDNCITFCFQIHSTLTKKEMMMVGDYLYEIWIVIFLHRNVNFTYILFTRSYLPFTDMFKKIKDLNIAFSNDRLCIQLLGIIAEKKSTWLPDLWDLGLCCPPGSRIPGHTARGVGQSLTAAEVALAAVYAVWRLLRAWNKCFFYQACRIFLWIFDPCELWNKIR